MKAIVLAVALIMSTQTFAATKCETDSRGRMCCWDTDREGPFKPISCY